MRPSLSALLDGWLSARPTWTWLPLACILRAGCALGFRPLDVDGASTLDFVEAAELAPWGSAPYGELAGFFKGVGPWVQAARTRGQGGAHFPEQRPCYRPACTVRPQAAPRAPTAAAGSSSTRCEWVGSASPSAQPRHPQQPSGAPGGAPRPAAPPPPDGPLP